jgi:hypothetical protein
MSENHKPKVKPVVKPKGVISSSKASVVGKNAAPVGSTISIKTDASKYLPSEDPVAVFEAEQLINSAPALEADALISSSSMVAMAPTSTGSPSSPDATESVNVPKDNPNQNTSTEKRSYYDRIAQSEVYQIADQTTSDQARAKGIKPTGPATATKKKDIHEGKMVHSAFNMYTLFNYRGTPLQGTPSGAPYGEYNKLDFNPDVLRNPTVATIVERTSESGGLGYRYAYSDFALCKYLGKIPNNRMVTLRRFPFPIEDDIITPFSIGKDGKKFIKPSPDIARAITWMSDETGNKIEEILNFDFGHRWKEFSAEVQELENKNAERRGRVGAFIDNSPTAQAIFAAANGIGANKNVALASQSSSFDPVLSTYPNHVFGPYNSIRDVLQREGGMDFNHEFVLTFSYEMRSLDGANPKLMFLDLMGQLLALTYSTAPFWGGAVRYIGGGQGTIGKPLGNADLIREGRYKDFLTSVIGDIAGLAKNLVGDISTKGIAGSNLVNNLLGGSLLKLFNTPQGGQVANALLTGDSTGQWHVTVGNPLNPMAVIGNLACTKTELNLKGPLGIQDFPEELELKITLKPARPRDKAEIETMFNAGRGRFYIKPYSGPNNVGLDNEKNVDVYGRSRYSSTAQGHLNMTKYMQEEMRKFTNG